MGRLLPGSSDLNNAGLGGIDPSQAMTSRAVDIVEPGPLSMGLFNLLRPLAVGIVHGLAGSAAIALLVMTTIPDPGRQIGYLLIFGFGTVLGMMMITSLIAVPFV